MGPLVAMVGVGGLLYTEHADVMVSLAASPVAVNQAVLSGGSEGVALRSTTLTASVTESQQGTSSFTALPGTVAYGNVTFWCSPMTSCPNGYTVTAGTIVESSSGVRYRTLGTAVFPSCAPSSPVAVSAMTAGAAGNAGAGTVVYGQFPAYIHVTNQWAVSGGTDAHSIQVVTQPDLDAVRTALSARVTSELAAQLKSEAGSGYAVAAATPQLTVSTDAHVGDRTPAFTVTVAGTLHATAFATSGAELALRRALAKQVPSGFRLMSGPIDAVYSVQDATITGSATGYAVPALNSNAVAAGIRGQSVTTAEAWLLSVVPGATVHIRTAPLALPWLPQIADHISIQVLVETAP